MQYKCFVRCPWPHLYTTDRWHLIPGPRTEKHGLRSALPRYPSRYRLPLHHHFAPRLPPIPRTEPRRSPPCPVLLPRDRRPMRLADPPRMHLPPMLRQHPPRSLPLHRTGLLCPIRSPKAPPHSRSTRSPEAT